MRTSSLNSSTAVTVYCARVCRPHARRRYSHFCSAPGSGRLSSYHIITGRGYRPCLFVSAQMRIHPSFWDILRYILQQVVSYKYVSRIIVRVYYRVSGIIFFVARFVRARRETSDSFTAVSPMCAKDIHIIHHRTCQLVRHSSWLSVVRACVRIRNAVMVMINCPLSSNGAESRDRNAFQTTAVIEDTHTEAAEVVVMPFGRLNTV